MKVLVCGSHSWEDVAEIRQHLERLPMNTTVIHGGARGADRIAGRVAKQLRFKVIVVPAHWERYGRQAGFLRNQEMIEMEPDLVLAFWDGESRGTASTIRLAKDRHIPFEVIR